MTLYPSLRHHLHSARLYLVSGQEFSEGRPTARVVAEALEGGVDIVQLREHSLKDAELLRMAHQIRYITSRHKALFIVNDRPDIAALAEADGVHLGQDDMPVSAARELLGEGKIVGVSTHEPNQAKKALADGADYIGVGPVFTTPTKAGRPAVTVEYVRQVAALNLPIPFFAIGGINLSNLPQVLDAGATRVAVVRAIVGAREIAKTAAQFKEMLDKHFLSVRS